MVRSVRVGAVDTSDEGESRTELDSHADTCVVGRSAMVVQDYGRPVDVKGYDSSQGVVHKSCKTISAALAYDCPDTGEVLILLVNQAIYIPSLTHNLLCPMQLWMNDVQVSDQPKFLTDNPDNKTHALVLRDQDDEDFVIPLDLCGVTSYFPTRTPTSDEYASCRRFDLTSPDPPWDPQNDSFARDEMSARAALQRSISTVRSRGPNDPFTTLLSDSRPSETACFATALQARVATLSVTQTTPSGKAIDAKTLARRWGCGLERAADTLRVTTQRGLRTTLNPLTKRFTTNDRFHRYRPLPHPLFTDTMFSKVKSRLGNTCAQVFTARNGWTRAYPLASKGDAHEALSLLLQREGRPPELIMDGAAEQVKGKFRKKSREAGCRVKQLEPYTPWANAAESAIRELKRGTGRKMVSTKSPKVLWDHCLELEAYIRSATCHSNFELSGQVPETAMYGETFDISLLAGYGWYDWVYYYDSAANYPEDKEKLGRYRGPATDMGPAHAIKILAESGMIKIRSTYRHLTDDEIRDPTEIEKRKDYTSKVNEKLGGVAKVEDYDGLVDVETPTYEAYEDDDDPKPPIAPDIDDITLDTYDNYVGADVLLPKGDVMVTGKVKRRSKTSDGRLKGTSSHNPILDSRVYVVEFPDGETSEYAANVIAENMYAQCDAEGNQFLLLDSIVDHRKTKAAVDHDNRHVVVRGRKHKKKTTKGWELCVQWRDGSTSWERLAGLKESNPIEVAEYAVAKQIENEPAFDWWVNKFLRRRDRILAAVNSRYHKRTHKFGIEIPKTVAEAYELDRRNGNDLWRKAIEKEMEAVRVAFKLMGDDEKPAPGFQEIRCHMVFDVKMEDFRRKARFVAGGHTTEAPATLTYASVVSRESVRIALTIAALNDLEVKTSDIKNAYLTAPNSEKIWTVLGPEFGSNAGKRAYIVRALYGLKSAGASFRNHLASCMRTLGYDPCLGADRDLWMKPMTRPSDGHKYYAYVLLYVDDVLAISHDATAMLHELDHFFPMKPGSIGNPDMYLGGKLKPMTMPNSVVSWAISSSKYVQEAVSNVETYLERECGGRKLAKRAATPFPPEYDPVLDVTDQLNDDEVSFYQSQIGVLRWMVELGRVDIMTETSLLASQVASPRQGHLEAVFHMYSYLKIKHNARMAFDPTYPEIDLREFREDCDWKEFYGDVKEAVPPNAPKARGKEVDLRLYVDSDHAGDKMVRRSRTGFFIFMNMAPIMWYTKRQATIETSVFGAEFVAMKTGMEAVRGLRYKLRMMGVPLSGPTHVYGDNMSVIHNTSKPESSLKKKSNSICYHAVREAVAMGELLTTHIPTQHNPADLATKVIPGGQKRNHLLGLVLWDITDDHGSPE